MKRPPFITNGIYHVYNRGVEKRKVFTSDKDRMRFLHDIYEFNDIAPALNSGYYSQNLLKSDFNRKSRNLLVEVLCFCLMPNHFHFLLRQRVDGGITEFMRKIGTGYTNYFNTKYKRVGPLFQGKFKAIHVEKEAHLLYLPHYIHLNPLDLKMPEWREQRIKDSKDALAFLAGYRWSSYPDYIGEKNFPSLTQRDFVREIYGSRTSIDYRRDMEQWLYAFDPASLEGTTLCD